MLLKTRTHSCMNVTLLASLTSVTRSSMDVTSLMLLKTRTHSCMNVTLLPSLRSVTRSSMDLISVILLKTRTQQHERDTAGIAEICGTQKHGRDVSDLVEDSCSCVEIL